MIIQWQAYINEEFVKTRNEENEPINMGIEQLKKYSKYCKKLEKNDMTKALSLKEYKFYGEVMQYMIENNCKLEQEIISWMEKDIQ